MERGVEPILYIDDQAARPAALCPRCGGECYRPGLGCSRCRRERP